ncbi:GGDEF domain-containing protein [Streptomyces sp. So13.3]|uniref:GGDEF domain-containing protein n=1 Tax=Streptomyces sp. So13.3 TaxID=2136173 RepID=UPI00164E2BAE|nr:GGDEF domain-containing protein [Streptomyces sp. So13.3]
MSQAMAALAAALPLAAGWSVHGLRLHHRIEATRRDPLTGLLNRDAFTARAGRALTDGRSAVYVLDLDRFKEINDTHGHAAGDAVLRTVGQRLTLWGQINGPIIGRLGGDEFAAITVIHSRAELLWMLGELLRSLREPIEFEGHRLTVGASIGAVAIDTRTETADLSALLRRADEAMYAAKQSGGGWHIADDTAPAATVNGRRAGRRGTHLTRTGGAK